MTIVNVHDRAACHGRACCVHAPSDHHMRDWPRLWRDDIYLMERLCPHGVGHPDPDHMAYMRSISPGYTHRHGCCGCCQPPTSEE